jgi:hypothetical protein
MGAFERRRGRNNSDTDVGAVDGITKRSLRVRWLVANWAACFLNFKLAAGLICAGIWAVACILYQLVSSRQLFDGSFLNPASAAALRGGLAFHVNWVCTPTDMTKTLFPDPQNRLPNLKRKSARTTRLPLRQLAFGALDLLRRTVCFLGQGRISGL